MAGTGNHSEVQLLRLKIEQENHAAILALRGLAQGVAKHQFITMRMERIGQIHEDLVKRVGEDKATEILIAALDAQPPEQPHP